MGDRSPAADDHNPRLSACGSRPVAHVIWDRADLLRSRKGRPYLLPDDRGHELVTLQISGKAEARDQGQWTAGTCEPPAQFLGQPANHQAKVVSGTGPRGCGQRSCLPGMDLNPVVLEEDNGGLGLSTIYAQIGHAVHLAAFANQEVIVTGSVMAEPTTTAWAPMMKSPLTW